MNPKQIFLIVFAHRYIAALVFAVVLVGGTFYTWTAPKVYQASTDLLVDSKVDPIAGAAATAGNYVATQIAILQSERVAVGVINRLKIASNPGLIEDWKIATKGKIPLENYYANLLRKNLQAEALRGSNIIRLTFEGKDAKFVTAIVNTYAQAYLDLTVDLRVEPVRQYSEWFDERLKTLRADVEQKQTKLSEYQRTHGLVGSDQKADVESQRLDALMSQLVSIQSENMAINSRQKTSGGELSPDVQASSVVQNLRADLNRAENKLTELSVSLGPNHPQRVQLEGQVAELKQQITVEMGRVSGSTGVARTTASLREGELRGVIAAQKERVLSLRSQRDEVSVLAQDVEAAKAIYESVLQRSNQLNLEKQTDQANVSILSPAVEPAYPYKPDKPKFLAATVMGALAAAFAAAMGLEMLNRKVRVVQDIMVDDVPVLGIIERRGDVYSLTERLALFQKFFTKRRVRKEIAAASRLGSL
ncbi:chain length determinant protein EpsF [Rhodoferax lacus]|uniref:Chain length determinant protein EpsF n=1 Tax=Rhodoferax lacus TaxID=2184758 RepID=A0A3E1RFJ4_9BURK|nr:GNVR domain-containing protein [Rhodoferax lacus]RFO97991.1 chain length determinant protein EpsF [Rhodoferax lacus]